MEEARENEERTVMGRTFPFADAASIVQSHQKDEQILSMLIDKLTVIMRSVKGQLFVNLHPRGIAIAVKLLYFCVTTLKGVRTLGEEYVDLRYVDKSGKRLTKVYQRVLFVLSYCFGPFALAKIVTMLRKKWETSIETDEDDGKDNSTNGYSVKDVLDLGLNVHLMLFYFRGSYYNVLKRVFGLRYVISHKVEGGEKSFREKNSNTYKLLGMVLLLQTVARDLPLLTRNIHEYVIRRTVNSRKKSNEDDFQRGIITHIPRKSDQGSKVSLSNPDVLPFIPENSRTCTLCLSLMTDPSCAPCGHIYCWDCLMNWCNERPECPLCRQKCNTQQIQPLI